MVGPWPDTHAGVEFDVGRWNVLNMVGDQVIAFLQHQNAGLGIMLQHPVGKAGAIGTATNHDIVKRLPLDLGKAGKVDIVDFTHSWLPERDMRKIIPAPNRRRGKRLWIIGAALNGRWG
ncbi:hypothetical protein D3C79_425180 [compost metagenome]